MFCLKAIKKLDVSAYAPIIKKAESYTASVVMKWNKIIRIMTACSKIHRVQASECLYRKHYA